MSAGTLSTPVIMAVSDRARLGAEDDDGACRLLVAWAAAAASAGIDLIQIRERGLTDRLLHALVRDIGDAVRSTAARVVVNERTDVALAAGASGVHLPSSSPPSARVREAVPASFLIGRSIHAEDQEGLREREAACDYLLFGTVFPSTAKPAGHPVAGVATLKAICDGAARPILAIGGMNVRRVEEAARAGAAGIAAIGLFTDPMREADSGVERALAAIVDDVRKAFERGAGTSWTQATGHR